MARPLRRDASGVSNVTAFLLAVISIAAIVGVYYVYVVPGTLETVERVEAGDQVEVSYIGTFADTNLVFDTSERGVAEDNASYPKAGSFGWRARWDPLTFLVGDGQMIRGFDEGVRGLAEGETRTIVVSPGDGYGAMDPSLIVVRPLLEPVPVRSTMNVSAFNETYGFFPVSGINVTDPVWGWDALVSVAGNVVTVTNAPVPGESIRPYGAWDAEVVSIDDAANEGEGVILVRHRLDASMVDRITATERGETFYLASVDAGQETFTLNFNRQVVGRTLIFQVTVGIILKA